jgi:hypothetical protein
MDGRAENGIVSIIGFTIIMITGRMLLHRQFVFFAHRGIFTGDPNEWIPTIFPFAFGALLLVYGLKGLIRGRAE